MKTISTLKVCYQISRTFFFWLNTLEGTDKTTSRATLFRFKFWVDISRFSPCVINLSPNKNSCCRLKKFVAKCTSAGGLWATNFSFVARLSSNSQLVKQQICSCFVTSGGLLYSCCVTRGGFCIWYFAGLKPQLNDRNWFQSNISQHCWAQHVARVCHPVAMCCYKLDVVGSNLKTFKFFIQHKCMLNDVVAVCPGLCNNKLVPRTFVTLAQRNGKTN